MKISQVLAQIHKEASGVSHSVPNLCESLARKGVDVEMHVLAPVPEQKRSYEVRSYPFWPYPARLGISPSMAQGLNRAARRCVLMHVHSLWMMPSYYPPHSVDGTDCRLITSPRGTLSAWALRHSRWVKRAFWAMGQKELLKRSVCFHATAENEYHEIRQAGFRAPVAVIPNGVHVPERLLEPREKPLHRLLFISRIHPIKGIDLLLRIWRKLERDYPDWELWVVGPDSQIAGYTRQMQLLAKELGLRRVSFPGPAYGETKERMYFDADLFVLPTHSENFGIVVAEALAHGVPAVVSRQAPWQGLQEHGCGWWPVLEEASLEDSLREGMSLSAFRRREMGLKGREWIRRDYSWEKIGAMMLRTYEWLLGGGERPAFVEGRSCGRRNSSGS